MAGFYPIMMFGLPAAALAMWAAARPNQRKVVSGVLISAALTALLTGITEPIEFAFMFLAPVLYVIHATFDRFVSRYNLYSWNKSWFWFSAGLIDYVLSYGISTKPLLLL